MVVELMEKLFEPDQRRLSGVILQMNRANRVLMQSSVDGFRYMGQCFVPKDGKFIRVGHVKGLPELHDEFYPQMEQWCKDAALIQTDRAMVRQTLYRLLDGLSHDQDIRDALPECLVSLVPYLTKLERTNEPGFNLKGEAMAYRQFQKMVEKLEIYSAVSLFF